MYYHITFMTILCFNIFFTCDIAHPIEKFNIYAKELSVLELF